MTSKETLRYWFAVFLVLFSMASLGLFLAILGTTENILLALGSAILLASALFSIIFVWYGSEVVKD